VLWGGGCGPILLERNQQCEVAGDTKIIWWRVPESLRLRSFLALGTMRKVLVDAFAAPLIERTCGEVAIREVVISLRDYVVVGFGVAYCEEDL
jgi:hypothetical protein